MFDTNGAPVPCDALIEAAPVTVPEALPATGDPNALDYCGADAEIEWVQEVGVYICTDPTMVPVEPVDMPDSGAWFDSAAAAVPRDQAASRTAFMG